MNNTTPQRPWEGLELDGTQSFEYPDNPRVNLYPLFRSPPRRVLDVGCAVGAVGLGLKQKYAGAYVVGCELDATAAEQARHRLDAVVTEPLRSWTDQDKALLPTFDTVLLLDVLEHMYNPWIELQYLAQNLLPSAQIIISLPNMGHVSSIVQLVRGHWRYESQGIRDVSHIRFFTEYEMVKMFYQTGFRVEKRSYLALPKDFKYHSSYPVDVQLGDMCSIKVRNETQWAQLNAIQIGFRLSIVQQSELTDEERKWVNA